MKQTDKDQRLYCVENLAIWIKYRTTAKTSQWQIEKQIRAQKKPRAAQKLPTPVI